MGRAGVGRAREIFNWKVIAEEWAGLLDDVYPLRPAEAHRRSGSRVVSEKSLKRGAGDRMASVPVNKMEKSGVARSNVEWQAWGERDRSRSHSTYGT